MSSNPVSFAMATSLRPIGIDKAFAIGLFSHFMWSRLSRRLILALEAHQPRVELFELRPFRVCA
jgi:hypothetical protein